jgi:hypothetical protein
MPWSQFVFVLLSALHNKQLQSNLMGEWTKVVTNPLGLAGFALFLVFGYLAKMNKGGERRWIAPMAFALAMAALLGGLAIAYVQVPRASQPAAQTSQPPAPAKQQTNQQVRQTSTGDGSPNVQGVQGNVTITVDQSKGKTELQKPPAKNPNQETNK